MEWEARLVEILEELPSTESQKKFAASVLRLVRINRAAYPTMPQEAVLRRIYGHLKRKQKRLAMSDVELQVLEYLGR